MDTDGDINGGTPLGVVCVDNGSTSGTAAMLAAAGRTPREREGVWPGVVATTGAVTPRADAGWGSGTG